MEYSLKDFTSINPVTATIAENMVDLHLLDSVFGSFEDIACSIFTKAYEICRKIINESPIQIWRIPDFYRSASFGYDGKDADKIMGALTLSVVSILAEHFDENLKFKNQDFLNKLVDYIKKIYLTREIIKIGGTEIVNPLGGGSACISAYHGLRRGTEKYSWLSYEQFYPDFLKKHDELVRAKSIKTFSQMKIENGKVVLDVPTLCNVNIGANKNNIIDQGGEIEERRVDNSEKEYKKQIEDLKAEIERLKTMNEVLEKQKCRSEDQNNWYQVDGDFDKLSEEEQMTQRERLVFFATVLSLEFNKKYTIAQNLGTFLKVLCNDNTNTLGPLFSKMKKTEEFSANKAAAEKVKNMLLPIIPKEYRNDSNLTINKIVKSLENNFIKEDE